MCVILDESRETVRKLCASGEIPAIKIGGKWKCDRDLFRGWIRREISCEEAKKCQVA
jgi:excisionase family DNA binding protein